MTTSPARVTTWSNGFGLWYVRVAESVVSPIIAARRALRDEILERDERAHRSIWMHPIRCRDLDTADGLVWREGIPGDPQPIDAPVLVLPPASRPLVRRDYVAGRRAGLPAVSALYRARRGHAWPADDVAETAAEDRNEHARFHLTREGVYFVVSIVQDTGHAEPFGDCYSDEDLEAWRDDQWTYVGVVVTAHDQYTGLEIGQDSLWGIDAGEHWGSTLETAGLQAVADNDMLGNARADASAHDRPDTVAIVDSRGVVQVTDADAYRATAPGADVVTCGECGRAWDDAVVTGWTPTPGGRCPYEYEH